MTRIVVRTMFLVLVVSSASFFLLLPNGASQEKNASQGDRHGVLKLIGQLGSDEFLEREQALGALARMPDALPDLWRAIKSEDAEIRCRAKTCIDCLMGQKAKKLLRDIQAGKKPLVIDEFIDQMVLGKEAVKNDIWPLLLDYGKDLAVSAMKKNKKEVYFEFPKVNYFKNPVTAVDVRGGEMVCQEKIITNAVYATYHLNQSLIVSRGEICLRCGIGQCVVFANGSIVSPKYSVINSVIFCDGDVTVLTASTSLIVATGKVRFKSDTTHFCLVLQNLNRLPLGELYTLQMAGIDVTTSPAGAIKFVNIDTRGPFARSGVRQGDCLVSVDGKPCRSKNTLRRAVRRAFVEGREMPIVVRREDKQLSLLLSFQPVVSKPTSNRR